MNAKLNHTGLRYGLLFLVFISFLGLAGCSGKSMEMNEPTDNEMAAGNSGQCWSLKGGVGKLLKNSCTKAQCKSLGGKSWCPVGGGCENL